MNTEAVFKPQIVVFACENSGWLALGHAAELDLSFPEGVNIIKLPCSGKIDVIYFLKAMEKADGTVILACQQENCKFLKGNVRAAQRVKQTQRLLQEIGIEEDRVGIFYLAANMGHKFVEIIQNFYDKMRELGPNPGKVIK